MSRRTRDTGQAILQRRQASGLGVGCVEAQADGVPCPDASRDCAKCDRAAAEAAGRPLGRRVRRSAKR